MGAVRENTTGRVRLLESDFVIGRASHPYCALSIDEGYVSGHHAEIRWTGQWWELKDLGSTNGTYVDGQRMPAHVGFKMRKGSAIAFGKREQEWEMTDDTGPSVMAVPLGGGDPVMADEDETIALPSTEDPRATLCRNADGSWLLEQPGEPPTHVRHMQTFHAAGRQWRFDCSEDVARTVVVTQTERHLAVHVRDTFLVFSVSRNLEYVRLEVHYGHKVHDMGALAQHFLLFTLARRRLADAAEGEQETARGWLDQEDIAHDPSMAGSRLHLATHRLRTRFRALGLVDPQNIVERRLQQIRIGTDHIEIKTV